MHDGRSDGGIEKPSALIVEEAEMNNMVFYDKTTAPSKLQH